MKTCPQCGRSYTADDRFCTVDGATLLSAEGGAAASLVGTVLADRYLMQARLGERGMGEVYLAEHVRIKRQVAVNLMRSWMANAPIAVSRFHRGAENASQISHPTPSGSSPGTARSRGGGTGDVLLARLMNRPTSLAEVRPEVPWPAALQDAFSGALHSDPAVRHAGALDFAAEFDGAIATLPLTDEEQAYLVLLSRLATPSRGGMVIDALRPMRSMAALGGRHRARRVSVAAVAPLPPACSGVRSPGRP